MNVNMKWRVSLLYICIFNKGRVKKLNKGGQEVSFWFMIDITSPPPAINNEWSLVLQGYRHWPTWCMEMFLSR